MKKFLRFCVVGGTVAVVNFGLLAFFTLFFRPNVSFVCAYFPSVLVHFGLNKWWAFRCKRNDMPKQFAQYLVVVGINFSINLALYNVALRLLTSNALLANLIALPASMCVGYILFSRHVFAAPTGAAS